MTPFLQGWLPLVLAATFQATEPAPSMTSAADSVAVRVAIASSHTDAMPTSATLTIQVGDGTSGADSGIPGFIVQLDPPKGLRLDGDPVVGFEALHANQFLMEPWARLITEEMTEIGFAVESSFDPTSTLGINVLGYVAGKVNADGTRTGATLLRRRFELKIEPGSVAQLGDATDSSWGPFDGLPVGERPLVIGDKAPGFTGPSLLADGSLGQGSLEGSMRSGPLIVAMYRGHW